MSGGESEKAVTDDRTIETDETIVSGGQASGAVGGFDSEILGIEEVMANIRLLDLPVKCGVGLLGVGLILFLFMG